VSGGPVAAQMARLLAYLILACGGVEGKVVGNIGADRAGAWGGWSAWYYCDYGKRMTGFQIRVEGGCGDCDDTGMNGFKMHCQNGDTEQVDGYWGSWHSTRSCASGFTRFRQKIEGEGGDDTAMNDISLYHSGCGDQTGCGDCGWGSWSSWSSCPSGAYICGFRLKVEGEQGDNDDTAANSVEFKCPYALKLPSWAVECP
jgi:hypothetical protein